MWPASRALDLDVDNLYVKPALANDGPRMKRIRPAPMGRAFRYQRRLTHIVLSVAEREAAGGLGDQGGRATCGGADAPCGAEEGSEDGRGEDGAKAAKSLQGKEGNRDEGRGAAGSAKATKKKAGKKA